MLVEKLTFVFVPTAQLVQHIHAYIYYIWVFLFVSSGLKTQFIDKRHYKFIIMRKFVA